MRFFVFALAALLVACNSPGGRLAERTAPQWREAQLADLRAAAVDPADGFKPASESVARLMELEALSAEDDRYADEIDAAADDLFLKLAEAHARGVVDPAEVGADWHMERPPAPDAEALRAELAAGALPSTLLRRLAPNSTEYAALRAELARLYAEDPNSPRIPQLRANLERWRWLVRDLPTTRIEVRIAEFALYLHRPNETPRKHAVIVGARRTPTPIFSAEIQSITLNPTWTPPRGIVVNELAPRFRNDPAAAAREGYDVLDASGRIVDPAAVDWNARPFPYQLRQRPGAANALGRIRFDMANAFAVYLHDTPSRGLFARETRALSHGCVRVEAPLSLATAVNPAWSEEELTARIGEGATQTLALPARMPVYMLYFTTTLTADGEIVYLDDVYGRDGALIAALDGAAENAGLVNRQDLCSP